MCLPARERLTTWCGSVTLLASPVSHTVLPIWRELSKKNLAPLLSSLSLLALSVLSFEWMAIVFSRVPAWFCDRFIFTEQLSHASFTITCFWNSNCVNNHSFSASRIFKIIRTHIYNNTEIIKKNIAHIYIYFHGVHFKPSKHFIFYIRKSHLVHFLKTLT